MLMQGLIEIYCGDGKGKTTASLGLALRAAGNGLRVRILQFLKGNDSSEYNSISEVDNIKIQAVTNRVKFVFKMTEEEKEENRRLNLESFNQAVELCNNGNVDLMIFDEIIGCINMSQLPIDPVIDFLKNKPQALEVVLTGRDPDERLIELADYVSEIKKIKHPFDKGVQARKGIEY